MINRIFSFYILYQVIIFMFVPWVYAQLNVVSDSAKTVEVTGIVLSKIKLADQNLSPGSSFDWAKQLTDYLGHLLTNDTLKRDAALLVTLHKNAPAEMELYSVPEFNAPIHDCLNKHFEILKCPNTRFFDIGILFKIKINGGTADPSRVYQENRIEFPEDKRYQEFCEMNISERLEFFRQWSIEEVIPTLSYILSNVDEKYFGVRGMGSMLSEFDFSQPLDIEEITYKNSDYWHATLEMVTGNKIIPITYIFLCIANGEIDKAKRVFEIINLFASEDYGSTEFIGDLSEYLEVFYTDLNKQIMKGIELYDDGMKAEALETFNSILTKYPKSAWANHEWMLTKSPALAVAEERDKQFKELYNQRVYDSDPLYPNPALLCTTGKEVYQSYRRMQIQELFKDSEKFPIDLVDYGLIALDLEEYGFAAQFFYISFLQQYEPIEEVIGYFLYCLEILEIKDIKDLFKGEYEKFFKRIEAERRKMMEESPMYKAMKESE